LVMEPRGNHKRCGLDIGGTQIKSVILDESLKIVDELIVPSLAHLGPNSVKKAVLESLKVLNQRGHVIEFVGIGCAGSVDSERGLVRNSPNFAKWNNINLSEWITPVLNAPVKVDNDANCATLAEWKLGKGRGVRNLVLLTLGTGIGGGLVLNNKLYRGSTGTGGELGHFSIMSTGVPCPCGNVGCFERYCSATALKTKMPNLSAKEVFDQANSNAACRSLVAEFLIHLKVALTSLANIFDPDLILLGGAVSKGIVPYLEEIQKSVLNSVFPAIGQHLRIDSTQFENNSGAIGAALLDLKE
jgi:glucokinase